MAEDADETRLKNAGAKLSEHYKDYLVCVRTDDGWAWAHSDPTWGVGAAELYISAVKDKRLLDHIQAMHDEGAE